MSEKSPRWISFRAACIGVVGMSAIGSPALAAKAASDEDRTMLYAAEITVQLEPCE